MVPEGWTLGQVSDVCRLQNGYGFTPPVWDTKGLPIIRIQNLNGSQNFNYYSGEPNPKWLVEPGQMLFAWAGTKGASFGPTIWKGETGVLNQHIFKVFQADDVDHDWLFALLRQVTDRIETKAHGFKATLVHVKKSDIENQPIHIPPLPEQRKIADILSTWDAAIEKTEALLATAKTQKRALMQSLLTGRRRFPEFEGQPWKEVRLGDMGKTVSGGTPDSTVPAYWDGDIDWATPTDITKLTTRFIRGTARRITPEGLKKSSAKLVGDGALLICTRATIGDLAIATGPICTNQGFKNLVLSDDYDSDFVFYLLQFFKNELVRYACGSTFLELSKKDFDKRSFHVPALEEQRQISAVLNDAEGQIAEHAQSITKLRTEKKALMQQLLTGKRRVVV